MTTTAQRYAKSLKVGDEIKTAAGNWLRVTAVKPTENRIVILFNGDLEIDFRPYAEIKEVRQAGK